MVCGFLLMCCKAKINQSICNLTCCLFVARDGHQIARAAPAQSCSGQRSLRNGPRYVQEMFCTCKLRAATISDTDTP